MSEKRDTSKKPDASECALNHLSLRKFLNIFANGAIALVPLSGVVSAQADRTLYDYLFETDAS